MVERLELEGWMKLSIYPAHLTHLKEGASSPYCAYLSRCVWREDEV